MEPHRDPRPGPPPPASTAKTPPVAGHNPGPPIYAPTCHVRHCGNSDDGKPHPRGNAVPPAPPNRERQALPSGRRPRHLRADGSTPLRPRRPLSNAPRSPPSSLLTQLTTCPRDGQAFLFGRTLTHSRRECGIRLWRPRHWTLCSVAPVVFLPGTTAWDVDAGLGNGSQHGRNPAPQRCRNRYRRGAGKRQTSCRPTTASRSATSPAQRFPTTASKIPPPLGIPDRGRRRGGAVLTQPVTLAGIRDVARRCRSWSSRLTALADITA